MTKNKKSRPGGNLMRNTLLKRLLLFTLIISLLLTNNSIYIMGKENIEINDESVLLKEQLVESLLYTEEDVEEGFKNYAEISYTLPAMLHAEETELSNVVGTVFDHSNGSPIEGVKIFIDEEEITETDENGRFQIRGLPDGLYNWKLTKDGYCEAEYNGYGVNAIWGASIFCFYLSSDEKLLIPGFSENDDVQINQSEKENNTKESDIITEIEESNLFNKRIEESLLYTDEDVEKNFEDYADVSYTSPVTPNQEETKPSNVVGTVFDEENSNLVEGVSILVNDEKMAETDKSGRFQIRNLPDGLYNWKLSKEGYCEAEYNGYGVNAIFGASIFLFHISKDKPIKETGFSIDDDILMSELSEFDDKNEAENSDKNETEVKEEELFFKEIDSSEKEEMLRSVQIQLPIIRVMYPDGTINRPAYDYYISVVISNELYNPNNLSKYYPNDMTYEQYIELFKAGAVTARTFAASRANIWSKHHSDGYDLCSDDCCQKFNPTERFEISIQAVKSTTYRNMEEVITYDGEMIQAAYFSFCNGLTLSSKDVTSFDYPYLRSVECLYETHSGYFGQGYGLCQFGASRYAYHGYSWASILKHYYTGTSLNYAYTADSSKNKWQLQNGNWYYFDEYGRLTIGWKQVSGKWYYFNKDGKMQTGWIQDGGNWYYCDSSGAMVTGRYKIDGRWNLFDSSGVWLGYDD